VTSEDSRSPPRLRFRNRGSLRLRLIALVVLTVLAVLAVAMVVDYRRERRAHTEMLVASLEENARAVKLARGRIPDRRSFAEHVDEFCAQMNRHISPGHHVLVLDEAGEVIVSTRHHSGSEVERALLSAGGEEKILSVAGHDVAQVRLKDDDGATIILAQYLDHMQGILRDQMASRALTAGAAAVAVMIVISLMINLWVLRPFSRLATAAKAWSARTFSARCPPTGPRDLRGLAGEFNSMAEELERHEKSRIEELERARQIQANLLPPSVPSVPGLSITVDYRPAGHVGGDLYDIFDLPDGRTAVAVLDVAGHGISAALLTGVVKMSLHRRLAEREDLPEAMELVNADLNACISGGQFVTTCVGVWNPRERTWTYCAAGHPGGMAVIAQQVRSLPATGVLLGVLAEGRWSSKLIKLSDGDQLFLYTDGIVEAGAPHDKLDESGLERILASCGNATAAERVARVTAEVDKRTAGRARDDATIVALEVLPDRAG